LAFAKASKENLARIRGMVAARAHATCQTGRGYAIAQVSGGDPAEWKQPRKARL